MKINANLARPGNVLEHEGRQCVVLKIQLINPGKGGAFVQLEMRDIKSGSRTNVRLRTADTVERLTTEEKEYQYLFHEGDSYTFMDQENFEQISLPRELIGEPADFLADNMIVTVDTIEGKPVAVHLPSTVVMEIVEADPVVKGQTAASSYKPAKLANGRRIMVPPFVGIGVRVVVNTEDASYVERAKA